MIKSKYELPDYFRFYNAAVSAYTNAVLGTNALMLECSLTATRTMLRATGLATPVAAAPVAPAPVAPVPIVPAMATDIRATDTDVTSPADPIHTELARIEASLYAGDMQKISTRDTLETTPVPRGKKAATRRRRGKK